VLILVSHVDDMRQSYPGHTGAIRLPRMGDRRESDPQQGVFRWAWKRGYRHVDRLVVGGVGFFLAGYAAGRWVTDNPFGILLLSIVGAFVLAYLWAWLRAPYEQRDALRKNLDELGQQLSDAGDSITVPQEHVDALKSLLETVDAYTPWANPSADQQILEAGLREHEPDSPLWQNVDTI